ncbi:hypothetical protein [Kribbella italica]|uniref:Uncharacterized protein n=1 Tax=Kribbella italica TaxID=1540520 RepID=A0A7W9MXE2_9ACTN|nr:hypothetical protein [Kribbella italica]MBB5839669.1 hypothetical protein [Kribbella italica]
MLIKGLLALGLAGTGLLLGVPAVAAARLDYARPSAGQTEFS